MTPEALDHQHGIAGELEFFAGRGGLPMARVTNDSATALISIYAGQVLSYWPAGEAQDLLFVSEAAYFAGGKAIKGGIPVCWPWFGPDPEGRGRAAHGFARNRSWQVRDTAAGSGETRLLFELEPDDETRAIWPYAFGLTLEIVVGPALKVALTTRNTGTETFGITQALHTYFNIGAIEQTEVSGLEDTDYLDKAGDGGRRHQSGPVVFAGETDRIYTGVGYPLTIHDRAFDRRIQVDASGSTTAVVWNPWSDIAARMGDLDDTDYLRFVCVEAADAGDERIELQPGGEHRLAMTLRSEPA